MPINGTNGALASFPSPFFRDSTPPSILGPDGQPYRKDGEFHNRFGGRQPLAHVITFAGINSALGTYLHGRSDEALRQSPSDARAMRRDCFVMSLLRERKLGTVSLNWHIEVDNDKDPEQRAVRDGLTWIIKRIPHFKTMLMYLLEAIWYGKQGAQLVWDRVPMKLPAPSMPGQDGGLQDVNALVPVMHQPVNGDKLAWRLNDMTPILMVAGTENASTLGGIATQLIGGYIGSRGVPLEGELREYFIIHQNEMEDADFMEPDRAEAIFGVGIRDGLYWIDWLRKEWLANVADWCERTGLGIRLWHFQGGNAASEAAVAKAAREQSDRVNILIPHFADRPGTEGVEFVDTASTGADLLLRLQTHLEEMEERFVIGQTLSASTEGHGLGGTGVASLHAATKQKIIAFDAANLGETLTTDLVRVILKWTWPDFADLPVRFVFDLDDPDANKLLTAVKMFLDMGGTVKEDDVRSKIGFSEPTSTDKVLKSMQMGMPGAPGMDGMGGEVDLSEFEGMDLVPADGATDEGSDVDEYADEGDEAPLYAE